MNNEIMYMDINSGKCSEGIDILFPDWESVNERVCIFSPHDDDAIIGAGYTIEASIRNGAEVFVFIFCNGKAGYSDVMQKEKILEIRKAETKDAYNQLGVESKNIITFDYPDFSVLHNIGWFLNNGNEVSFKKVVTLLRKLKITRLLVPNHYREHIDHTAVSIIGSFDSPQAGDPVVVDWGIPNIIKSTLEYTVWADLSPVDSLIEGRRTDLRANRIISVDKEIEMKVCDGISAYESQRDIIRGLIESRKDRLCNNGRYIEVYLAFNPRPKLDYKPYKDLVEKYDLK